MNRDDLVTCPNCAATNEIIVPSFAWRVEPSIDSQFLWDGFWTMCANCGDKFYIHLWIPSTQLIQSLMYKYPDGFPRMNVRTKVQCPFGQHGFEVVAPKYATSVIARTTESKTIWQDGYLTKCPQPNCRKTVFIHLNIPPDLKQELSRNN